MAFIVKVETLTWPGIAVGERESTPTRSSLIVRLRDAGDDASWRLFFDTYWRLIYNVACKSGLSDADAKDVVQETVIAVAKRMPEFRYDPAKGSFKQWLLLITRRRIQDHLRRVYRSGLAANAIIAEGARGGGHGSRPISPPDVQIEAAWEESWRENFFQAALARVRQRANPKQFQVFDYCVLQELPVSKVAQMLGLSAPQVYLAKHRMNVAIRRAAAELEFELDRAACP
jgi:RNA polymerase sigma factor (sigma-70 family)